MTHRERVMLAFEHKEADRLPRDLGGRVAMMTEGAYYRLKDHLNVDGNAEVVNPLFMVDVLDERILERFDVDIRRVFLKGRAPSVRADGTFTDEWGVGRRIVEQQAGRYGEMVERPLKDATVDDVDRHDWPNPRESFRTDGLRESALNLRENTDYAVSAAACCAGLFELSWFVRGYEQFLIDMMVDRDFAMQLVAKVCEVQKGFYEAYLGEIGDLIDMIEIHDDYGMQTGPIMSPQVYREVIKPFYLDLVATIRSNTKVRPFHHSCGSIVDVLDDLIEAGVDVINPVQPGPTGMGDPVALKKRFGDRICFHGGIDEQHVLPHGSPADVAAEVRKRVAGLAPGGGYILASAHNIQADTPPENVIAMFDAAEEYGRYPIRM